MPINFQQIRSAIHTFGQEAPQQARLKDQHLHTALSLLQEFSQEKERLQERIQLALGANPDFRCALPSDESLNETYFSQPSAEPIILLAADGSQIIPDQHLAIQFGVINVGLMRMQSGSTPSESIESDLLFSEDIFTEQGFLVGEELIALRRDHKERSHLLQAALQESEAVLTITDGPLELFREGRETREYQNLLEDYLNILAEMAQHAVLTAGYVDKPRSDLLIRTLELTMLPEDRLSEAGRVRQLPGITDADVFARILQPQQRSAIFRLNSSSSRRFQGPLAIHFFYLNIGREGKPQIARVEIPEWVLNKPENVNHIHHHLLDQCQIMGVKAYPYILHRAHEIALVSYQERQHLLSMLQQTLLNQGLEVGEKSSKQHHKDASGKKRYRQ